MPRRVERIGEDVDVDIVLSRIDDLTNRLKCATQSLRGALEASREELTKEEGRDAGER